jgi:hypothetical protein
MSTSSVLSDPSPMLSLLCQIAGDELGCTNVRSVSRPTSATVTQQQHPVLSNETTKSIILRYHQQRAHLQRALEVCAKHSLEVPEVLLEALHYIITDSQPATAGMMSGCSSSGGATRLSSPAVNATRSRPGSAAALCGDAVNLTRRKLNMDISEFAGAASVAGDGLPAADQSALQQQSVEGHISLATHALLNHPNHPGRAVREFHASQAEARALADGKVLPYSPSKTSSAPKMLLEAAHGARRDGNPRQQIAVLVDYLRRGQEGSVALDTSATTRILRTLADAHIGLGEYVSAEQYLFDWYMIAEKVGDRADAVRALVQLGSCSHGRGDVDAARDWLTQAKRRAPERLKS